jgi:hypothetical protein
MSAGMNRRFAAASFLVAVAVLFPRMASAQTPFCNDTTMLPNPVYLSGSSTFETAAGLIAPKLTTLPGGASMTLIYSVTTSCDGPAHIRDGTLLTGTADYWTPDPSDATKPPIKHVCSLDGAPPKADVGVSDVFYENCPGNALPLPTNITDVRGPVLPVAFVVPEAQTQVMSLSAPAAAAIWGCANGNVAPFNNTAVDTQQRNQQSGTQNAVGKVIGVPPGSFYGVMNASSSNLIASLNMAQDPLSAIGFLNTDVYDLRRNTLNALAFRAPGQNNAYYADSTADTFDKRNVRDGRYYVWSYVHFFAATNGAGTITNTKAASLIGWITGTLPATFDATAVDARAGLVAQCAMHVARDLDGGPLRPYVPGAPCGCYWESIATNVAPSGCQACASDGACGPGKRCTNGFCE